MQSLFQWITLIVGIATSVGTALWWAIKTMIDNRHLHAQVDDLRAKIAVLEAPVAVAEPAQDVDRLRDQIEALRLELHRTRLDKEHIFAKGNQVVEAYRALDRRVKQQQGDLARAEKDAEDFRNRNEEFGQQIGELEKQIESLSEQDGRFWQRPLAPESPRFRDRAERGFPIISILNLKGGVGKTTIAAHLAGALGLKGKRVLVVDLDYQRSLSMMLVPNERRRILHLEQRCLQHFLGGSRHGAEELLACADPISRAMANCSIITNSDPKSADETGDGLEETEARLMAEWMVWRERADIRLFLREALHAAALTRKFDYVLLDCPPRLTTACINALAASDFVLIPVVLDALSTRPLPELLRSLQGLREELLPNLSVLGVVANLTTMRNGELIQQEAAVWGEMPYGLANVWGTTFPFFKTKIPDKALFGRAAGSLGDGELRLALDDAAIKKTFAQLIAEIEKEIQSYERLHASTVSS